jgi:hypothetical protein
MWDIFNRKTEKQKTLKRARQLRSIAKKIIAFIAKKNTYSTNDCLPEKSRAKIFSCAA